MGETLDNLQLVVNFLIQNPVLHELPLFNLLDGKHFSVPLLGDLVHHGKGSLSDVAHHIVLVPAVPVQTMMKFTRTGDDQRGGSAGARVARLVPVGYHNLRHCKSVNRILAPEYG